MSQVRKQLRTWDVKLHVIHCANSQQLDSFQQHTSTHPLTQRKKLRHKSPLARIEAKWLILYMYTVINNRSVDIEIKISKFRKRGNSKETL